MSLQVGDIVDIKIKFIDEMGFLVDILNYNAEGFIGWCKYEKYYNIGKTYKAVVLQRDGIFTDLRFITNNKYKIN